MKRVFVINPDARGGRAGGLWKTMRAGVLGGAHEHLGDPAALLSQGFDEWVVVGGDGSVQRAVEVLMQARGIELIERLPSLRVLPLGTGGDYARSLSMSEPKPADLGRVVLGLEPNGPVRYFANVASVGLSAQEAEAKEQNPAWVPRPLAYLLPTITQLRHARPRELSVQAEGFGFEGRAWAVFICKGRWAGGGMRFGVDVELADGEFEVGIVEDFSIPLLLGKLPQLYAGGLALQPGVRKFRSSRIVIEADGVLPMDLDGEPVQACRALFECVPALESGFRVARFDQGFSKVRA